MTGFPDIRKYEEEIELLKKRIDELEKYKRIAESSTRKLVDIKNIIFSQEEHQFKETKVK